MRGAKPPQKKTFYLDGKDEVGRRKGGRRDTPGSNWQSKCQVWRGNFTESVEEISRNSSNRPGHTISESRKKKHEKNDRNFLCAQMSSNVKIFLDESCLYTSSRSGGGGGFSMASLSKAMLIQDNFWRNLGRNFLKN